MGEFQTADILGLKIGLSPDTSISVLAIYRLHGYNVDIFVEELDNLLKELPDSNILISGDLNIDLLKETSHSENYLRTMSSHGLYSLIDQPTRITY